MIIYELYACDAHRSVTSLNIRSRIIATRDEKTLKDSIQRYLKEEEDAESRGYLSLTPDEMLQAVRSQLIGHLHYNEVELDLFV